MVNLFVADQSSIVSSLAMGGLESKVLAVLAVLETSSNPV
jgi:hypothetical protein